MNGEDHYKVKWKGFTEDHNTWEPASSLAGCRALINKFYEKVQTQLPEKITGKVSYQISNKM